MSDSSVTGPNSPPIKKGLAIDESIKQRNAFAIYPLPSHQNQQTANHSRTHPTVPPWSKTPTSPSPAFSPNTSRTSFPSVIDSVYSRNCEAG
ncbi:uncharacterized protein PADG_11767 [Paracoccidioides brasiliensis Pb18]|uniref:Uncharacterized protein n=1 Tax=Paracoccidioides brasiliensis (strain Pb18) TaxID=502780 RepID=A0A0A0HST3_PARBD|nr:uncharacterized protein PADG_11767 [Paracoccidioides brasiliensis Pb18]KGM92229.1 hypothetical protein PADG_11767 [Paracoccidioides brasiliensis Pb18]